MDQPTQELHLCIRGLVSVVSRDALSADERVSDEAGPHNRIRPRTGVGPEALAAGN
jgi:hypothetical protein